MTRGLISGEKKQLPGNRENTPRALRHVHSFENPENEELPISRKVRVFMFHLLVHCEEEYYYRAFSLSRFLVVGKNVPADPKSDLFLYVSIFSVGFQKGPY